jgi:hypothetical protein
MTSTCPSFDEAIAFWRELLRGLSDRLVWLFAEDEPHPRSSGAGEWLARRAYELANPTLTEPLTKERADVLASVLKGH